MRHIIQSIALEIKRVDTNTARDSIRSANVIHQMQASGFSMKGGIYVEIFGREVDGDELFLNCYVPVARRIKPVLRLPENGVEAMSPDFMEYRCFTGDGHSSVHWGSHMINMLISNNYGKLPQAWLDAALNDIEAITTTSQ